MTALLHISEVFDFKSVLVFISIFLLIYYYVQTKPAKTFPPRPWSLPFIGDLHHIDFNRIHLQCFKVGHAGAAHVHIIMKPSRG